MGTWSDVAPRAALGNQLPLYFGGLWYLNRTFGASELVLRLPSLIAWIITLVIVTVALNRVGRSRTLAPRTLSLWPLVTLLALDRGQIFFATEARPYALLSLINLLAWLSLDRMRQVMAWPQDSRDRCAMWLAVLVSLDALAFWIQPTAVLHIAAQFICLLVLSRWYKSRRLLVLSLVAGCGLLAIMWPARSVLLPAWQHRQQWASFASDLSLAGVQRLMPLAWLFMPVLLALTIQFIVRRCMRGSTAVKPQADQSACTHIDAATGLWLCAGCLPLVIVLLLATFQIAPLAHPRYLVAAVPPLLIASGWLLSRIDWLHGRRLVFVIMLATLITSQRDVPLWMESVREARWPMVARGEDWRGAGQWMVEQSGSRADSRPLDIFCASMLIEGSQPTGDDAHREYLALPLMSIYMPSVECRITSLLNAPSSWRAVVESSAQQRPRIPRWLVVRVSARALPTRLEASGLKMEGEPKSFGGVQVVRLAE